MSLHQEPNEEHVQVLQKYFGHKSFKREQWNIIRAIMYEKRDCCVIASTGFGKSLIYQYPAVFLKKLVVVISPLIALMQDQVFALQKKGIKACFFGSQQLDKTLRMQDHQIVYITPEYYVYGRGKSALVAVRNQIALFAVDEAHVLDQWGNDFRPAYKQLHELRVNYPTIPIIALTATAPKYVENMITSSLRLHSNFYFVKTALDRPNLEFIVQPKLNDYVSQVLPYLQQVAEGSAIVYCLSRDLTVDMADTFTALGVPCKPYHAGLNPDVRKTLVSDFRNNKVRFVICTIAFGMGIDKPDVRLVLHYGLPKSLEAFYQEAGRAGRDGNASKCVLLHGHDDYLIVEHLISDSRKHIKEENRQQQRALFRRVGQFASSKQCRRLEVLNYLGTTEEELEKITIRDNCCDNCRYDLVHKVPTHMQYCDVSADGFYDFTEASRTLLSVVNRKLLRHEVVEHLSGNNSPSKRTFLRWNLRLLNIGERKANTWWEDLLSLLVTNLYIDHVRNSNVIRLNHKSKKFLRFKSNNLRMVPSHAMLSHLEKKKNVEFFWQGETIAQRPSTQHLAVEQDLNRDELDSDEDLDDVLAACDQIESDSMIVEGAPDDQVQSQPQPVKGCGKLKKKQHIYISDSEEEDQEPIKTREKKEVSSDDDEDENFFDEATLKAIQSVEETEKRKVKVVTNSQRLRDQKEIEDIINIFNDSVDDEISLLTGNANKRCHEEQSPQGSKLLKKSQILFF